MTLFAGRQSKVRPSPDPPAWLVTYYLFGKSPERGTPAHSEFVRAVFLDRMPGRSWASLEELLGEWREALAAEAQRAGVVPWWPPYSP